MTGRSGGAGFNAELEAVFDNIIYPAHRLERVQPVLKDLKENCRVSFRGV